jgi:hypothetical protein
MVNDTRPPAPIPFGATIRKQYPVTRDLSEVVFLWAAMPRRVPAVGASPRTAQLESTVAARAGALAVADTVAIS